MIPRIPWFEIGGRIADSVAFQITDIGEAENGIGETQDFEWNTKSPAKESVRAVVLYIKKNIYMFIYI